VIDVNEGVRPEALLQLFTSENVAGAFKQNGEDLKRLTAKFQFDAGFANFSRNRVNFKDPEADGSGVWPFDDIAANLNCRNSSTEYVANSGKRPSENS
jgi:hypothetical protein